MKKIPEPKAMLYIHDLIASLGSNQNEQASRVFRAGKKFSHLIADTEAELVTFALTVGLKREWLQYPGTYKVHFDITTRRFNKIVKCPGVKLLTIREFGVLLKERHNQWIKEQSSKTSTVDSGVTESSVLPEALKL